MRRTVLRTAVVLAATTSMAACGDSGAPSTDGQVNFNLATRAATSPAAVAASMALSSAGTPETYSDGTNTLIIDQVQLVLGEIELKRAESAGTCSDPGTDSCEELELGPVLLDLPLGGAGGASRVFSVIIPPGTFDEVDFEVHKPSSSTDAAFVQAHPDFEGVSVKVTGTYNGQAFTYTSDLDAEEEIALNPPLAVGTSASTDLTLFVDLNVWFRNESGQLVDPASANTGGANESLVKSNITSNLHAFEDENRDGIDDGGSAG